MLKEKIIEILNRNGDRKAEFRGKIYSANEIDADKILSLISDTIKECVGEEEKLRRADEYISLSDYAIVIGKNAKRNEIINKLKEKNLWNEKN